MTWRYLRSLRLGGPATSPSKTPAGAVATRRPLWRLGLLVGSLLATGIAIIVIRPPMALDVPSAVYGATAGIFDVIASALFIYASQRVIPEAAIRAGYQFRFPMLEGALLDILR